MGDVTVSDIAQFLGLDSDDKTIIKSAKPIAESGAGDMTMARASLKNAEIVLSETQASLIIADNDLDIPTTAKAVILKVENARLDFMRVLGEFFTPKPEKAIHETVIMGKNVTIGEGTIIHPNVTLYDNVTIGKNCVIHSGCVIGSDGFGFEKDDDGEIIKFPHVGGVEIHDNVEVMALTHIARGTLGNTVIGRNSKIDSLCHIAHNVEIGENCMVIACTLIGGSTIIKDGAYIAPCASIINKVTIGEKGFVGMNSFVNRDVEAGQTVIGSPARPRIKQ